MRTARSCLLILVLALAAACAGHAGAAQARPQTIVLGATDIGRTIGLHVGDRLVIDLAAAGGISRVEWSLVVYPKQVLRVTGQGVNSERFEFLASSTGTGQVALAGRYGCDIPQAAAESGSAPRCPLGAGESGNPASGAAGAAVPVRRYAIDVQVG